MQVRRGLHVAMAPKTPLLRIVPVLASRGGQPACTVHFLAVLTCASLACFALSLKPPNVGRSGRGRACQFSSRRCMGPLALSPRQTSPSTTRWACLWSREMRHVCLHETPTHTCRLPTATKPGCWRPAGSGAILAAPPLFPLLRSSKPCCAPLEYRALQPAAQPIRGSSWHKNWR
jgi:hypothetical protein